MSEIEHARLETRSGQPVLLKGVKVIGDLRGLLFEATVEQRFSNPTDTNIEVVYTFPLQWGAVLLGVDVLLGDKRLSGSVVEKKQAEARYEETLSDGNAAIMLEKNHDLTYSLNLGNLAAHEDCVITLRYAQTLHFEQRGLRLLVPTVIAPRYGDAFLDGGMQPHQSTEHSLVVDYPFDIELRLHGSMTRARVASPSHPIGIALRTTDTGGMLTVTLGRLGSLDRDFVLIVDQLAHESDVVMARDCVEADGVVVLAGFCPRIAAQGPTNVAVKVLVDCSGSMGGDSIDAAKRALQEVVRQFERGDRFSLSRFGSTVVHRSRGLWSTTDATKLAAQRWVKDLDADLGGTEMEAALGSTFALAHTVESDVLVVTDGEIHAIDKTIESASASRHRLFVVGIGSSPSESHLRRLADATGGACDFVASGEAVEPAVLRMFARLRSPRMSDVKLVWPEAIKPQWQSPFPESVFDGDTVNVFAMLKRVPSGDVCLMGIRAGSGEPDEIARATLGGPMHQHDTLSRLAANQRVQTAGADLQADVATTAARLAVAYQPISEHTNFLLVHVREEAEKPIDMPELQKVPQMMPAGWSGAGSVRASASRLPVDHAPPMHISRCAADANASYGSSGTPAVWRGRTSAATKAAALSSGGMDDYEIPAFLRKQADASKPVKRTPKPKQLDKGNSDFWANPWPVGLSPDQLEQWRKRNPEQLQSMVYVGLTPAGIIEWLNLNPTVRWPVTYAELHEMGLGLQMCEWLEFVIGDGRVEREVVVAFLQTLSRFEFSPTSGWRKLAKVFTVTAGSSANERAEFFGQASSILVDAILLKLQNLKARQWPDDVVNFAEADDRNGH